MSNKSILLPALFMLVLFFTSCEKPLSLEEEFPATTTAESSNPGKETRTSSQIAKSSIDLELEMGAHGSANPWSQMDISIPDMSSSLSTLEVELSDLTLASNCTTVEIITSSGVEDHPELLSVNGGMVEVDLANYMGSPTSFEARLIFVHPIGQVNCGNLVQGIGGHTVIENMDCRVTGELI